MRFLQPILIAKLLAQPRHRGADLLLLWRWVKLISHPRLAGDRFMPATRERRATHQLSARAAVDHRMTEILLHTVARARGRKRVGPLDGSRRTVAEHGFPGGLRYNLKTIFRCRLAADAANRNNRYNY
jgi:hypothetical protein